MHSDVAKLHYFLIYLWASCCQHVFARSCTNYWMVSCERMQKENPQSLEGWIQKSNPEVCATAVLPACIVHLINLGCSFAPVLLFVSYYVNDTQRRAYGGITSLWIISTRHMFPYRTCCWTVNSFSSDGWSADRYTWRTCVTAAVPDNKDSSCSQTGPALLIMETQHPSSRRTKQADITFSNALLPSRKHQCAPGLHRRQWGKKNKRQDGGDVVEVGCH